MVIGTHFYITMISSLGWQGVTALMCLKKVTRRMDGGRQRTKSKKELALWKPASKAAIERNAGFMARLCADKNTATTSSGG